MNEKANVSKELNFKHRKILEGLLKLPENRECADCKCKGPRWASINLGIFVCMQCSGIHRSLGVHISKVRSATLDTWLPEQVEFIQTMGNEKSNSYWEAKLPPNYDRVGIENFIRAKYEDKRWVPKDNKPNSPSRALEDKASVQVQRSTDRTGHVHASNSENSFEERKNSQADSTKDSIPATRFTIHVPPRGPEPIIKKSEPIVTSVGSAKQTVDSSSAISPRNVDFATNLFNMLSMDGASENSSEDSSADDNGWAGFQSAAEGSTADKLSSAKPDDKKIQSASGIEDLFQESTVVSEKPRKDVKTDIMSLFETSNVVSPFAFHQQQIALLAQQQSLLIAAAAKSGLPTSNWPNVGYQFPGMTKSATGNNELQKYTQQTGHIGSSSAPFPTASIYMMGQNSSMNDVAPVAGTTKIPSASSVSSSGLTQTGKEYDFSSLTQGMFSKS